MSVYTFFPLRIPPSTVFLSSPSSTKSLETSIVKADILQCNFTSSQILVPLQRLILILISGQEELSVLRSAWEPLISPELAALLFAVTKGGLPNQDGCINAVNELLNQLHGPHALQHTGMSSLESDSCSQENIAVYIGEKLNWLVNEIEDVSIN